MKGLVLAGGKGSRLRPFTYSGAKQLVPVANVPVIHYPLRQLVEAGITEIGIVCGETEAQVREAIGDGAAFGAKFTYLHQAAPLGIAHAVLIARNFLEGDEFVLYLGDNVLLGGIAPLLESFRAQPCGAAVVLKRVVDPRAFGVADIADGRLLRVVEKPSVPPSELAVIGVYAFSPAVVGVIEGQRPSARGELEIADAINGLIAAGHTVVATETPDYWIDTGKMADILAANRILLDSFGSDRRIAGSLVDCEVDGPVFIEPGARIERCKLRGPVTIGADAQLRNSTIGPYVAVGPRSVVRESGLRNTILMEDSEVFGCPDVRDSMLGRFVHVDGAPARTVLTLGDHSRLETGR